MTPDSGWLEILKESGWKTAALAAASGLFWLTLRWGWFSSPPTWASPLAFLAFLVFGLLTVTSIFADLAPSLWRTVADKFEKLRWTLTLRALPKEVLDLLAVVEQDGLSSFYYFPGDPSIELLRDKNLLQVERSSPDGRSWAKYRLNDKYQEACYRHRPTIRFALKNSNLDAPNRIRAKMIKAEKASASVTLSNFRF